ncbi:MAG: anti-phage-associated DUF3780 domain-containing protein [Gammaproteobacteria bacterium]
MTSNRKTLGFGCPNDIDPHHFVVTIPAGRSGAVTVTEHFGLLGGANGIPEQEDRAVIARAHWNRIADSVKRVFNERLKANKLPTSRWKPGANKIERLLGKELCVLAWGIEKVELNRAPVTLKNWSGFKPEERWWLFSMTAASAGTVEDGERGWRRALFHALTAGEGEVEYTRSQRKRRKETALQTELPFTA